MEAPERTHYLRMPEMTEKDFAAHIQEEDFCLRYGNPVYIRRKNGGGLICMARECYERLRGQIDALESELEVLREDENIKYWIYEFEMPWEKKLEFDRACAMCEMTPDEFFESAVEDALRRAESDPEGLQKDKKEILEHPELGLQMRVVRSYPVYKGETEAQALKRKLAEEAAEKINHDEGGNTNV